MKQRRAYWMLLICLSVALAMRLLLILRTGGVIDGDEALVGIQGQHILQGQFPLYFYGQPYLGSLEAYLLSCLFVLFGSSAWMLRAEPLLLSLIVVVLTWILAGDLVKRTTLSLYERHLFQSIAALSAAVPPLYDGVVEARTWGGWIELYVLILLILLVTYRLSQHFQQQDLWVWEWVLLGFLVGLGFWIYPLVATAICAVGLWIAGSAFLAWRERRAFPRISSWLSAFLAVPAGLLGFAPGIVWGASHNWENLAFIVSLGGHESLHHRLTTIMKVAANFGTCIAPRVIGGGLPTESSGLAALHLVLFVIGIMMIGGVLVAACRVTYARQIIALPALFLGCVVVFFCLSSASESALVGGGCTNDFAGRYATPLAVVLPFFFALAVILMYHVLQQTGFRRPVFLRGALLALFLFLFGFLQCQGWTYILTSPGETFQSPYCVQGPWDDIAVLSYLEKQHINHIWGNNLLIYPLVFKSNGSIIGADPMALLHPTQTINRIPADTEAVEHAERPSMLVLVPQNDTSPQILQDLDKLHVSYGAVFFFAQPGYAVLVVTPLNQTVSPIADHLDVFQCVSS